MGLRKYSSEVVKEAKRVRWPKRDVLIPTIVVVLFITFFAAFVLFVEDAAVGSLLGEIERVFAGFKN